MAIGVRRIEREHRGEFGNGGIEFALCEIGIAAHAEGFREFLAQADRLGEIGDRAVVLALVQIGGAAVEIGRRRTVLREIAGIDCAGSSVIAWS